MPMPAATVMSTAAVMSTAMMPAMMPAVMATESASMMAMMATEPAVVVMRRMVVMMKSATEPHTHSEDRGRPGYDDWWRYVSWLDVCGLNVSRLAIPISVVDRLWRWWRHSAMTVGMRHVRWK